MTINQLIVDCHELARDKGFWEKERNFGEMIALVHSELSEALESHRKGTMDDHLPDHPGWHVELADAVIRIFDMAGGLGVPLQELIEKKLEYNSRRPKMHGKSY